MKKIFISLTLLISLSFVAIVATSMTEAWIEYVNLCVGCGYCWDNQTEDAFSENYDDGLAWWGRYNTYDIFVTHCYVNPDVKHWSDIEDMSVMCPVGAIFYP